MSARPLQRYVAEFVGTFGLLVSVTGAAVFTLSIPQIVLSAPGAAIRILMISIAIGGGLVGVAYAFGDLSGGHFNPAVTIGVYAAGGMAAEDVVPYVLAQVAGGITGVAAVGGVAHGSSSLWQSTTASATAFAAQGYLGNGSPYGLAMGSVFLLEVVLTFLFVTVILFATRAASSPKNLAPLGIGLTLLMINLVAIPIDGASVNPARSFAPAVLAAAFAGDRWAIQQDWLFWVAPVVGALLAAAVERLLRPRVP